MLRNNYYITQFYQNVNSSAKKNVILHKASFEYQAIFVCVRLAILRKVHLNRCICFDFIAFEGWYASFCLHAFWCICLSTRVHAV